MTVSFKTGCQVDLHNLNTVHLVRVERHVRLEEHVVRLEIRFRNFRCSNHVVHRVGFFHNLLDRFRVNRSAFLEQTLDRRLHA